MPLHYSYSDIDLSMHYSLSENPRKSDFRLHSHKDCELYYFLRGKGYFRVEGSAYALNPGDIMLMRPYEAHYVDISPDEPYERMVINFKPDFIRSFAPEDTLLKCYFERETSQSNHYSRDELPPEVYSLLLKRILKAGSGSRSEILFHLLPLLKELDRCFEQRKTEHKSASLSQEIIRYIHEHLQDKLSLEDLCNHFYVSKSQLCRSFKNDTGSTVQNYIRLKRLDNARILLSRGYPPKAAALESGYNDYSVFYRSFLKQYRVSPRESSLKIFEKDT